MRSSYVVVFLAFSVACGGGGSSNSPSTDPVAPIAHSSFEVTARILGPVEQDDNSDILVTLRETGGVAATLHFVRLTCSNGAAQEWGASSFIGEWGTNTIGAHTELRFQRHYHCPNSARPSKLTAQLTDVNGMDHTVEAIPYHPDWPG